MQTRRLRTLTIGLGCGLITLLVSAEYDYWDHQRQCVQRCEQLTNTTERIAIGDIKYSDQANICQCQSGLAVLLN